MQKLSMRTARIRHGLSMAAISIGCACVLASPAFAQGADEEEDSDEAQIIVTGSRVQRSTFDTPSPVTVFNSENVDDLGLTDVGDIVSQLPSNSNFFASNNVGLGNFNVGAQFVNLRGLNPFFGTRTLTLVDTHRVVPTATGGGVDITLIPSMLVDRTETVTGGASALYGSDAIAGVVNIILDNDLDGLKAQADFTRTDAGDGNEYHASAAYGAAFAGGRGHFVVGGEYQQTDAIGNCSEERDWCGQNFGLFTNTGYATNGQPHYIIGENAYFANQSLTGVLVPCTAFSFGACINVPAVSGDLVQFNADGSGVIPFDRGTYSDGAGFFGFRQGGNDQFSVGAYDATTLRPEVERYTLLGHMTYELGGNIEMFLEGSYAESAAVNPVATGAIGPYALEIFDRGYAGFRVFNDNAFLPAEAAALIGPDGAAFGRNMLSEQTARNETNNSTWRALGGLEGEFGNGWVWDAYFSHGENKNDQHLYHNVVAPFLTFALDAVQTGTGISCGVDVPGRINPNTGLAYTAADIAYANSAGPCVPLNLFGIGNADPAAVDYAFRTLDEFSTIKQDVFAVNFGGNLFDGFGAGAVKLAVGGEWRRESVNVTHDLANTPFYNDFTLSYGLDYGGDIEVVEGYGELIVPVFEDSALGRYFELDLALRGTSNKAKGTAGEYAGQKASSDFATWKISALWDVTDWLRLRGTRSRDIRAPQFRELFQTYNRTVGGPFGSVANPWNGGLTDAATITTGGNVALQPEKADTWTLGIVLSPQGGGLSGLRLSADWYEITISDAIAGPPSGIGAGAIVAQCFAGVQSFCDLMEGEGTNDITFISNTAANLQGFTTRGVDFEAGYNTDLGGESSLNVRVLASLLYDQLFSTGLGSPVYNYAGQTGPTAAFGTFNTSPKWQGNAFATYHNGPATVTVQMRYIGAGSYATLTASGGEPMDPGDAGYDSTNPNSISDNSVDAAAYFNLSGSFSLTDEFELFGSINNLFDKDPVIAPGGNGFPTNPVYFDTFGRTYRIGVRVRL